MYNKLSNIWIKILILFVVLYFIVFLSGKACSHFSRNIEEYVNSAITKELATNEDINNIIKEQMDKYTDQIQDTEETTSELYGIWKNVDDDNQFIEVSKKNITVYSLKKYEDYDISNNTLDENNVDIQNVFYYEIDSENNILLLDGTLEYRYEINGDKLNIVYITGKDSGKSDNFLKNQGGSAEYTRIHSSVFAI